MKREHILVIAFACLTVLLVAPIACAGAACGSTGESDCVAFAHDDGPQAVVKPLATLPAPGTSPTLALLVSRLSTGAEPSSGRFFAAPVPLRI